jgi:thiamine pyrophosphokinase
MMDVDLKKEKLHHQDYNPYLFIESNSLLNYGIIILNYSLDSLRNLLKKNIWDKAIIRGCADGGANMLKIYSDEINENFLPDFISGDFDSINEKTFNYYKSISNTDFIKTPDPNATDFTKCVRVIMEKNSNLNNLLVFCSLSGRFDHTTGIIHSLYILNDTYPNLQIYLITDYDITFLLHANKLNRIHIQSKYKGDICSLLPFGQSTHVQTEGLKWNINKNQELSFTKLVSSSNTYESQTTSYVDVYTDNDIIWTMTYAYDKT